jgi:hypothetical protein
MKRKVSSPIFATVQLHHIAPALPCILGERLCLSLNSVDMGNLGADREISSLSEWIGVFYLSQLSYGSNHRSSSIGINADSYSVLSPTDRLIIRGIE